MNTVAKGNMREREFVARLMEKGWMCERKPRVQYQSPDFFGMFDILAVRGHEVIFVQIKSVRGDWLRANKDIQRWLKETNSTIVSQCWYRENGGIWKGKNITQNYMEDVVNIP